MAKARLANGTKIEIPDGLSEGGAQDWILQNVPGTTNEMVGLPAAEPLQQPPPLLRMAAGFGRFLAERGIPSGADVDVPAPTGPAAFIGQAAAPVAAGAGIAMIPGAQGLGAQMALQGLTAAEIERQRTGSTVRSMVTAGGYAAGGTGLASGVQRLISGAATNIAARVARKPVTLGPGVRGTLAQDVAKLARGGGGLNSAIKTNTKAMYHDVAKAMGFGDKAAKALDDIDDVFLIEARALNSQQYKLAAPSGPVKVDGARAALADIPDQASPLVNDVRNALAEVGDSIPPDRWRAIQRSLREAASDLRSNNNWGQWATRIDDSIDALDDAAGAAGGSKKLLGQANQRYKLLATMEEINAVIEAGEVPAGELVRKLGRENFKGFGRRALAEGAPRLLPEIQTLMNTAKTIARFDRQTAGGSATAGRAATFGPPASAFKGLVTGSLGPAQALGVGSLGAVPRLGGLAAVGDAGTSLAARVTRGAAGQVAGETATGEE